MTSSNSANTSPGHRRWLAPGALLVTVLVAYMNRLNISLALPAITAEFGWSVAESGAYGGRLLGLFYIGYAASNVLLSGPAARMGVRRSMVLMMVLFSACTMLGGLVAGSLALLIGSRLLLGIAQGPHFPLMTTLTKHWFPPRERSRANGIFIGGMLIAPLLTPVLFVPVVELWGWRVMLFTVGAGGLLVSLPGLLLLIYDTPRHAPFVSHEEAAYIEANMETDEPVERDWRFLCSANFWLASLIAILNNFTVFGVMFWLPIYFTKTHHLPFSDLWYAATLPYFIGFAGLGVMAWLGDALNRRVLLAGIGYLLTAGCVFFAAISGHVFMAIAWFAVAVFFQFAYGAQEFAILQRILPRSAISNGAGIYNGIAVLGGGLLSTEGIGRIVEYTGTYTAGLLSVVVGATATGLVLLYLSRSLKY